MYHNIYQHDVNIPCECLQKVIFCKHSLIVLAALMLLCAQLVFLPSVFAAGAPLLIGTKEELITFRDRVNSGEITLNAQLTADIDLGGEPWTPIGNDPEHDKMYSATFDGAGHTVSGLKVQGRERLYQGFFGYLLQGNVKNLTVVGASEGSMGVGGIVGAAEGSSINNCIFKGDVTAGVAYVGGIVGYNQNGDVMNCAYFGGTVAISGNFGAAGGIAGYCQTLVDPVSTIDKSSLIANCIVSADIKNTNPSGGGIGGVAGVASYSTMANCAFISGSVVSVGKTVGGVAGSCDNHYMVNCVFAGSKVVGEEGAGNVGGVAGHAGTSIVNCGWLEGSAEKGFGTPTNASFTELNLKELTAAQIDKIIVSARLLPASGDGVAAFVFYPGKAGAKNLKITSAVPLEASYAAVADGTTVKLTGKTEARSGVAANFILTPTNISGGEGELAGKYALMMDGASYAMAEIGLNKPGLPASVYLTAFAPQPKPQALGEIPVTPVIKGNVPSTVDASLVPVSVDIANVAAHTGHSAQNIEMLENGYARIKQQYAASSISSVLSPGEALSGVPISLPIYEVKVGAEKNTAAVSLLVKGSNLVKYGASPSKLHLYKIMPEAKALALQYTEKTEALKDGVFTVLDIEGNEFTGAFADNDTLYQVVVAIRDNGPFDLNKDTARVITDPLALANVTKNANGGSSSGGCNAGGFTLALLAGAAAYCIVGKRIKE